MTYAPQQKIVAHSLGAISPLYGDTLAPKNNLLLAEMSPIYERDLRP